jgi:hypothetical protein
MVKLIVRLKGGQGSGHHGHGGLPGVHGGSRPSGKGTAPKSKPGWKKTAKGLWEAEGDNAVAVVSLQTDDKNKFVAAGWYAKGNRERMVWGGEEFPGHGQDSIREAQEYAMSKLSEYDEYFSKPPKKKRRKPGEPKFDLPYYD